MFQRRNVQAALTRAALMSVAALTTTSYAGQLLRVDFKSDNLNNNNINVNGGNATAGYSYPPEGGTLGGNADGSIGPNSTPAFEAWLINGGQVIDAGTGEITEDPRLNRYDYTSTNRPNLHAYIQANTGELINSAEQQGMVPSVTASTPYYYQELYRDYVVVAPPLANSGTTPTLTLSVDDTTGATLAPNTPYNVTLYSYVKLYDAAGNNETTINPAVYGNSTMHFTDATSGGLGSNTDSYQFVRPSSGGSYPLTPTNPVTSNPDTAPSNALDNYTWATTITVFTDANGQLMINEQAVGREQSMGGGAYGPGSPADPQRFQLDYPVLNAFEINDNVVNYTGPSGGSWTTNTNWAPGPNGAAATAPNGQSAIANFFTAGNNTVSLNANVTVGNLNFNSSGPAGTGTTITNTGTNTITLDSLKGPNGSVAIASRSGSHLINAGVIVKDRLSSNVNSGSSVIFTGDLNTATTLITERTNNTQVNANLVLHVSKLGGGTLGFRSINGVPQVRIYGGTLRTSGGVSRVNTLTFGGGAAAPTSKLDLTGGAWAIDYTGSSPIADIQTLIASGRNGGTWTGNGITSSLAAADGKYGVAFAEASALGIVGTGPMPGYPTVTIDDTTVVFRVTLRGDSDLNGSVTFDDLLKLAQNYNGTGKSWIDGDNTYDGVVNFDDLLGLAQNYGNSAPALLGDTSAQFAADWATALSLVPEPTTAGMLILASTATLRRRRG